MITLQKLAKELGIPPPVLLEKLSSLGYAFENIESKISAEQAAEVRGKIATRQLDERRVQPTIIRRRQKPAEATPTPKEEVQIKEAAPEKNKKVVTEPAQKPLPFEKKEEPKTSGAVQKKTPIKLEKAVKESAEEIVKKEIKAKKVIKAEAPQIKLEDFKRKIKVFYPKERKVVNIRQHQKTQITTPSASKRVVRIKDSISVGDLAKSLSVKTSDLIAKLMKQGITATINQNLDFDTVSLVASEYQYEVVNVAYKEEDVLVRAEDKAEHLKPRPPIVTIMGHVDHGKTTLLDTIRKSNVVATEAGGITQHIGAYQVEVNGRKITFIDTPGHAAFAAMRSRGARVTDIVVLVVAADDGIMPQTKEAATHAKEAKVSVIVAVNKIDMPGANIEKVKQQLTEIDLLPEDWGGKTIVVGVSALKKTGIKELLEMILLQADVLELKANPDKPAKGTVLESKLDQKQGAIVTLLIQEGVLRASDYIVTGLHYGKIRSMKNDLGKVIKEASPSTPVEVMGLSGAPEVGEDFFVVEEASTAQEIIENRLQKKREESVLKAKKPSMEELLREAEVGEVKELKLIIKGDVQGSIEALSHALQKLSTDQVKVNIIQRMVGGVTENDVHLATASKALIVGFHVRPEAKARQLAEEKGVVIKTYRIIYEVIDEVRQLMEGLLAPIVEEEFIGRAEVRNVFNITKIGTIAGCGVVEGTISRKAKVRLLRDSVVIYEGKIASLKRFKDDVKEVAKGFECGIGIENFNDVKVGDTIEAFLIKETKATLTAPLQT